MVLPITLVSDLLVCLMIQSNHPAIFPSPAAPFSCAVLYSSIAYSEFLDADMKVRGDEYLPLGPSFQGFVSCFVRSATHNSHAVCIIKEIHCHKCVLTNLDECWHSLDNHKLVCCCFGWCCLFMTHCTVISHMQHIYTTTYVYTDHALNC